MRNSDGRDEDAGDVALRLVQEHAAELLRFARRFSHCPDDAHDAYQRTVEILMRRMRRDPPVHPLAWARTVLRREALAVRAERERHVGRTAIDLDRHEDRHVEDPAEQAVGHERLRQTAEALRRLKPQEITALVLRAEGLTYREICDRTGWTYTRANRSITEGRRALRERLGEIESGAECARWLPLLSLLADGEATAAELAQLRPHLRSCPGCRGTLREFHAAPAHVAALVPAALLPLATTPVTSLAAHVEAVLHGLAERLLLLAARVQGGLDALPGAKLAAVAASTAALAGGGVAIEQAAHGGSVPQPAVPAAAISAAGAVGGEPLTAVVSPLPLLPSRGPGASARRTRRTPRGEFGSGPGSPPRSSPEFTPAPPSAEFAAAPANAAAAAPTAAPVTPAEPSEFGGP